MFPRCSNCATRPTSSMMPVNIGVLVWIVQITFYCEVLAKAVQCNVANISSFADFLKSRAGSEGHRAGSSQNLRRIIKEYLIDRIGSQSSPIQQSAAFDYYARDLQFSQAGEDAWEMRPSVGGAKSDLLDADAPVLQFAAFFLFRERTKDEQIVSYSLDHAGLQRKPQARVHDNPQQWTAARQA